MNKKQRHYNYFRNKRKYDECRLSNSYSKRYFFDEDEQRVYRIYHFTDGIKPFYKREYNRTIRRKMKNYYENIDGLNFNFNTDDYVNGQTIKKEFNLKNKIY